jgi:hypothetical protein
MTTDLKKVADERGKIMAIRWCTVATANWSDQVASGMETIPHQTFDCGCQRTICSVKPDRPTTNNHQTTPTHKRQSATTPANVATR